MFTAVVFACVAIQDPWVTLAVDLDAGVAGARLWTRCGPPLPGVPFCLGVDGGGPGQMGWVGLGTTEVAVPLVGTGGTVFMAGGFFAEPFALDAHGSSGLLSVVPAIDPVLLGVQLVAQGLTLGAQLELELTNGLRLRVGEPALEPYSGIPVYFAGDDVVDEHVVGDFNGDGYGDVVSYLYRTNIDETFAVHHGQPDGSLELVQELSSTQCNFVGGLTSADFDGDGRLDIALGCQWTKEAQIYRGLANGTFAYLEGYVFGDGLGLEPDDLAAGELTGDLRADLVAAMSATDELVVRVGSSGSSPQEIRIPTLNSPTDVELGDLDGDGRVDLIVGTDSGVFGSASAVGFHRGLGSQAFGALESIAVHPDGLASVSSIEVGDLTGDGLLDLVASFRYEQGVTVVPGLGGGAFGAPILLELAETCRSVTLGDVNLDGALDVIGVGAVTTEPHLWLGTGGLAFTPGSRIHPLGLEATQPSLFDMDADGLLDLVFGSGAGNFVAVLHGMAGGKFPFPDTSFVGSGPSQQRAADMNADGWPDLVTVTRATVSSWYGLNVRLGQPGGGYSVAEFFTMASTIPVMGVGDLNNDGLPDLVHFANKAPTFTDRFSIRLGQGDGTTALIANLGAANVYPRFVEMLDANNDGNLDILWATASSGGPLTVAQGVGNGLISNKFSIEKDLSNAWRSDVHDVDGDGDDDLILIDFDDAQVFLNEPAGSSTWLAKQPSLLSTGSIFPCGSAGYDLEDVVAGDLNGDGLADLAIALDSNCSGNHEGLAIALAVAPGVFAPVVNYAVVHHEGWRVELADVNLDGHLDVVLETFTTVEIFPGLGDGSLGDSQAYLRGGGGLTDLVVEDFDLDGVPDVSLVGGSNAWVQRLFNRNGEQP